MIFLKIISKYKINNFRLFKDELENITITKLDEDKKIHNCRLPDVVDFFAVNRSKKGKEMINEIFLLYNETLLMEKQISEEYFEIENLFADRIKQSEILKSIKNEKERNLLKSNILY